MIDAYSGIAHYTILSPLITTPSDIATNFFLMPESLGRKAAKEACGLLGELNGNVVGEWKDEVSEGWQCHLQHSERV